jgi:hypothetical protein
MASKSKVTQKIPASPWDALLPPADQEKQEEPTLLERQRILYRYGDLLEKDQLKPEFKVALGKALKAIAFGANAEQALFGQRVKRGGKLLDEELRRKLAIGMIASLVESGLSSKEAIQHAAEHFGYKFFTLRNYWNTAGTNRSPLFTIP